MEYIDESIRRGHISGDGYFTKKCQHLLQELVGCRKALLTTSCTDALEMAAILLDIQAGDEVIVPSFTFVSTINAFVLRGAIPVFADIRPDTLNIDESSIGQLLSEKTRAIVPVHYAGVGCEMGTILELAKTNKIAIVEDNAHGLMGLFDDKPLGSFGCMATQSFHETKNFQCGEGGALLLNDESFIERAEIIREKGTNRSKFFQGLVDKYTWVDIGSSYLPSDMLAAFLYGQLEQHAEIFPCRERIWTNYDKSLQDWSKQNDVRRPFIPANCKQAFHMYYLILPSHEDRQRFISYMDKHNIGVVYHYLPLNSSPMGSQLAKLPNDCPVTEDISSRLVRLPFYNSLKLSEQDYVIEKIIQFAC